MRVSARKIIKINLCFFVFFFYFQRKLSVISPLINIDVILGLLNMNTCQRFLSNEVIIYFFIILSQLLKNYPWEYQLNWRFREDLFIIFSIPREFTWISFVIFFKFVMSILLLSEYWLWLLALSCKNGFLLPRPEKCP